MKKLRKLLTIPEEGNLSEQTFFAQLALSVTVIVLCLTAMVVTAYVLFSYDADVGLNDAAEPALEEVELAGKDVDFSGAILPGGFAAAADGLQRIHLQKG